VVQAQSSRINPKQIFFKKISPPMKGNLLVAQTSPAVRFAVAFSPPAAGGFFVLTKSNNRENF
jgi:hypothetical protein